MVVVNPRFLDVPLEPFLGLADDDDATESFASVDTSVSKERISLIRLHIVPYVASLDDVTVKRIRLAYDYYLSQPSTPWNRVFDAVLPPFELNCDSRLFFVEMYECCFGEPPVPIVDATNVKIEEDANEPLRLAEAAKHKNLGSDRE